MSGRPRAAKPAAKSKGSTAQKRKPAAAPPKKPTKKPAARAAPAPAAAAPPAPERVLPWHPVEKGQRRSRTLATWVAQKENAAFFTNYCYTIKNEETGQKTHVFQSAFSRKDTASRGGLRELGDAFDYARTAYLSRVKDGSEVWSDPDAAALKERSREIIRNPEEPQNNRFTRNFRPGALVAVTASGHLDVVSYRQQAGAQVYARRSIDEDALSSLEAMRVSDPQLFGCVEDFAADISSMPSDEQHKLLWDRAQTLHEITVADAQVRADDFKRRVTDDFEVGRKEFEEDVGFDDEVKADLSRECGRPVTSLMDVDDFPRACLLGDADHCPIHDKIMEWFYLSERRNATRGVQGRVPLLYSRPPSVVDHRSPTETRTASGSLLKRSSMTACCRCLGNGIPGSPANTIVF